MHEQQGSLGSTNGNDTMNAHTNERRTDSRTSPAPQGNHRNRPRTYEQPALDDIPMNPRRGGYVMKLILKQHNWRHSSKNKGVSAYFSLSWTAFQADRGRRFSLIVDAVSAGSWTTGVARK